MGMTYRTNGVDKELTDWTVLAILWKLDDKLIGEAEACRCAREYLLRKSNGWSDAQMMENLDMYAAVVARVYDVRNA